MDQVCKHLQEKIFTIYQQVSDAYKGHFKNFSYFDAKQIQPFCSNHSAAHSKKSLLKNKGRKTIVWVRYCQISRRCQPLHTMQVPQQHTY